MKRRNDIRTLVVSLVVLLLGSALVVQFSGSNSSGALSPDSSGQSTDITDDTPADGDESGDSIDDSPIADDVDEPADTAVAVTVAKPTSSGFVDPDTGLACTLTVSSIRRGNEGANVICLQEALKAAGYYSGPIDGRYDGDVVSAVRKLQTEKDMFVDGVTGRETALSLGIWPDEESAVVHTPKPAPGEKDLLGYELSSVASAGDKAPPVPENSGEGRRLVYSRLGQRVWAIDDDGRTVRSWLVSGSKYANEKPGTHKVYSKSKITTAWNGKATLHLMVRWLRTKIGAIGFHQIPLQRSNKKPYQTEEQLGTRLSGGCQRQAPLDAKFLWDFADIGTKVVVI